MNHKDNQPKAAAPGFTADDLRAKQLGLVVTDDSLTDTIDHRCRDSRETIIAMIAANSVLEQLARELDRQPVDVPLSRVQPEDCDGLPERSDDAEKKPTLEQMALKFEDEAYRAAYRIVGRERSRAGVSSNAPVDRATKDGRPGAFVLTVDGTWLWISKEEASAKL